jgi:hypothetical protein
VGVALGFSIIPPPPVDFKFNGMLFLYVYLVGWLLYVHQFVLVDTLGGAVLFQYSDYWPIGTPTNIRWECADVEG